MCCFRRHNAIAPIAVILYGLFLGVFTVALQPCVLDPLGDRLPVKDHQLVALSDLAPAAAFNRGSKPYQTDSRAAFIVAEIYQPIELQGVSIIDSSRIYAPYRRPIVGFRLIRAPPFPVLL